MSNRAFWLTQCIISLFFCDLYYQPFWYSVFCILWANPECIIVWPLCYRVLIALYFWLLFAVLEILSCWLFRYKVTTNVRCWFVWCHWLFREWGFEKLVFRNSITGVRRDRKYAIQARNAYSTGVHMSQNVIGRTSHKTESLIRYYHYHNSINVMGEPCREFVPKPTNGSKLMFEGIPYVYDDNMKRLAGEIKRFEEATIGSTHT